MDLTVEEQRELRWLEAERKYRKKNQNQVRTTQYDRYFTKEEKSS